MLKTTLIISLLTIPFSMASADQVQHAHGEKAHSHALPQEGLAHKHGSLPAGSSIAGNSATNKVKSVNSQPPVVTPTKDKKNTFMGFTLEMQYEVVAKMGLTRCKKMRNLIIRNFLSLDNITAPNIWKRGDIKKSQMA